MDPYEYLHLQAKNFSNFYSFYNKFDSHRNYSENTFKKQEPEFYEKSSEEARNLNLSWKDFRILIYASCEILESEVYKNYLNCKTNDDYLNFCKNYVKFVKDINKYPDAQLKLREITDVDCTSDLERFALLRKGLTQLPRCKVCGNKVHYNQAWFADTCSITCKREYASQILKNLPPETKEKKSRLRKETCLKKYGVEHPAQSEEVKNKTAQTNLERYGCKWTTEVGEFQKKKIDSFVEKYGVTNPNKLPEVKAKIRDTCLQKYGTPNIKQSEYVKQIYLEKYGVDDPNLRGKNPECVKIVKDPILLKQYFDDRPDKSLKEIAEMLGYSSYQLACTLHDYKLHEYVSKQGTSNLEEAVGNWIHLLIPDVEVKKHDRTILYPQELDLYIPSLKLAIEVDGNYWHSEAVLGKEIAKTYHLGKTLKCKEQGIRLIHIFEYEWFNSKEKVKKFLRDIILPSEETIFARKCEVKLITPNEAREFFEENHLQGSSNAPIVYGLFHNNTLISAMSFSKPRFSKKHNWEISRFAVKSSLKVPGAAGKLLAAFRKDYKGSIITYSDASKMKGDVYRALGFTELKMSPPSYVWTRGDEVLSRFKTQKHLLLKEGYVGSTENEIMENRKYLKLYDCGNYVFELK